MMERSEILTTMGELKLYGMKSAYDEIITNAVKRQHQPERIVGDLLAAEIAEKQARSIKYQMTIAKLPLAKDIDDFDFDAAVSAPFRMQPGLRRLPAGSAQLTPLAPGSR